MTGKKQLGASAEVRREIDELENENEILKRELARESRQARLTAVMSSNQGSEVQRLQVEADGYLRKIEKERRAIEELDVKITENRRIVIEQKARMGGPHASKENHEMLSKQIRILEARLDKALQKFNGALAQNKNLRTKIDDLRRERVAFDGIYKKLEKELHMKKKEMAAIIEDSKVAYQRSDKAKSEMAAIKAQVEKEKGDFEREWRELGKLMDADRKVREQLRRKQHEDHVNYQPGTNNNNNNNNSTGHHAGGGGGGHHQRMIVANGDFMSPSGHQRSNAVEATDHMIAGGAHPHHHHHHHHGESSINNTTNNANSNNTNTNINNNNNNNNNNNTRTLPLQLSRDQAQGFEDTFNRLREATGVTSIKELVDTFQDIEQKNFSLFNSINELNSDIEASELAIAETKMEIEKYKGQGVSTDTQRKKVLRDLEDRVARTEARADEYDVKHANATKTINQLKTGIHSIFSRLGCASTSVEEMLGNQGVTESNMMQYLEIIEQRTTEILQVYAQTQTAASGKADLVLTSALKQGVVQQANAKLAVQPPAWDDFSSGDDSDQDDDERPLTREELQRKTLRGLSTKEKYPHARKQKPLVK